MHFFRANVTDSKRLTELRLQMRKERDVNFNENELRENTLAFFVKNIVNGNHVAFVCEEDGQLIASVGLTLFEMPPTEKLLNGKVIKLMNMYVVSEFRKQGIAKKLLEMVFDFAKEHEYHKIMLNSSPLGEKLYIKSGFTKIENEYELYID